MKHSEVKEKYAWRLEDIFLSDREWEKELAALNKQSVAILRFKGKLYEKASFTECMALYAQLSLRMEKLYAYAMMKRDLNGADDAAGSLETRAKNVYADFCASASFLSPELSALDDGTLSAYTADPDLKEYAYFLSEIVRGKKHILSEKEERLLAMGSPTFGGYRDVFAMIENVDMPFPKIEFEGKRVRLTHGLYARCLDSSDPALRKRGFDAMYKAVGSLIHVIAANYAASVTKDNYLAAARGYESAVAASTDGDDVPAGIYTKLVAAVGKNLAPVHEYVALRKRALGLETLHMYDLYTPLVRDTGISVDYEQALQMVLDGLKPLGEEYAGLLKAAGQGRWIDVYETENKRSGAYSCGVPSVHPYVLLNYSSTTHDVFTIAHELGHSMHSYYSYRAQTYLNADYSIFVAEVASTVNEVLLLKDMLAKETDPDKKTFLLSYYLDMFRTTLFRQTMFAEFELTEHANAQKGKALTVESMSKDYYKLNKKYYGPDVKHDKAIMYEWARIPHFYNAFYVYKYATGLTSAVNIAHAILTEGEEAVLRYKTRFLSAGGSKSPYEILCDVGVDLMTDAPYDVAMKEFADTLEELKTVVG